MKRRLVIAASGLLLPLIARAHHGWSSFDTDKPLWVEGKAVKVQWRNPHAEFELEIDADAKLPADLAQRSLPAQSATIDGPRLLQAARLPTRKDRRWQVELAPLSRLEAWSVAPIKVGDRVGVLGYTFSGEKGEAVLRAEYLFAAGKVYGLRSSPA